MEISRSENLIGMEFRGNIYLTYQFELIYQKIIEKNRINSLLAKSLRNFILEDIFLLLLTLAVLPCKKPSFQIYIKKKSFVTLNLKCIPVWKHICWPNQHFFVKKSWNNKKKMYLSKAWRKKIIKHLTKKVLVCSEEP